MFILNEGRKDFLDFLRNITPQIIFFSLALIQAVKFQPLTCCDLTKAGIVGTSTMLIFFGIWAISTWASCSLFLEKLVEHEVALILKIKHGSEGVDNNSKKFTWSSFWFAIRRRPSSVISVIVAMVVIEISLLAVMIMSISSATGFLKAMH